MKLVLITALGVGGATLIGALIGFAFRKISHKLTDVLMGFAAGVMLCAAIIGLILPSLEGGGKWALPLAVIGIFCGAFFLNVIDKAVPHLHRLAGTEFEEHNNARLKKILLFVMAIAIHNFPEGIAAGVGFGTGDVSGAISIALGIALQNIPEGMVVIAPMLSVGVSRRNTLIIALITGFIEVIGTLIGYMAVNVSAAILPFALAFAGGTMLYVISDEMIPETHAHGNERASTYSLIVGFCLMLVMDYIL